MARKPSNSPEDDILGVKMVSYEQALADLKQTIERHVKKDAKYRQNRQGGIEMPTIYKVVPRGEV